MAFPTGWAWRCKLTIDYTKVGETVTNFPVLLTEENFPAGAFTYGLNGGGDLRFSSDSSGATQLACEVVTFNTSTSKAEVWVKLDSISNSVNTDFYVWYGKAAESQPAVTDTYGRNAVWSNSYKAVYHMNEANAVDSTGNENTGTDVNTTTDVEGKWSSGRARDFEASNSEYIQLAATSGIPVMNGTAFTVSAWLKTESASDRCVYSEGRSSTDTGWVQCKTSDGNVDRMTFHMQNDAADSGTIYSSYATNGSWYFCQWIKDGTGFDLRRNTSETNGSRTQGTTTLNRAAIGALWRTSTNNYYDGIIDEVHVSNVKRSDNWLLTEYNNTNAPDSFVSEGTPEPIATTVYEHDVQTGIQTGILRAINTRP